jgi:hypothetical protein
MTDASPVLIPTMFLRIERRPQSMGWPTKYVLQQMWLNPFGPPVWQDVPTVDREEPQATANKEDN